MSSYSAVNQPVFATGEIAKVPSVLCACRDRVERDCYVEYSGILGWDVRATTDLGEAIGLVRGNRFDILVIAGAVQGALGMELLEQIRNESGANQHVPAILVADHTNILEMKAIGRRDQINIEHIEFGKMLLSSFRIIVMGLIARKMKTSVAAARRGP
ncbi:hypothetical protein [Jiella sonneratiae]|uniref:Response regulatory domain-containing protein n=1 Tax=Jiella sonneratiae TaxID=2816856 RepID=A0ABS3IZY5_9HYPH|nr:hypothetical protein [Jiella sonneratiae]MBO0902989.1 hypothetical protein [Jiella sonneratiae]